MSGSGQGPDADLAAVLLALARARASGPGSGTVGSSDLNASLGMLGERGERLEMRSGEIPADAVVTTSAVPARGGIREEEDEDDIHEDDSLPGPPGPGGPPIEEEIPVSSIFVHNNRLNPQTVAFYDEHRIEASSIRAGDDPFRDEGASVQQLLDGGEEEAQLRPVNISELNMVSRARGRTLSAGVRTLRQHTSCLFFMETDIVRTAGR